MAQPPTQAGGPNNQFPDPGQKPSVGRRLVQAVNYAIAGVTPSTWFSPMQPLHPMAPEETKGRVWDYPVAWNLQYVPRTWERVSFAKLKNLGDSCGVLRSVIETRKDQIEAMAWNIIPKNIESGRKVAREKAADRIKMLTQFFEMPDREHDWSQWIRGVLEQHFVYDGVALHKRRTRGGGLYALDQLDAATITVLIDADGKTPQPPSVAYQQILKGLPAADYAGFMAGDLIYAIKNLRPDHKYGYSPVEQIISYVELAISRVREQHAFYLYGDVPRGVMEGPPSLTTDQIKELHTYWESVFMGNIENRSRLWWVPNGSKYTEFKKEVLFDQFDEWLARVICYAFSISPQPFTKMMNRSTAQTNLQEAAAEGLQPTMRWVSRLINKIIVAEFHITDLEFSWEDEREFDPTKQAAIDNLYLRVGAKAIDEVRDGLGLDPLGGAAAHPMFATPNGFVQLDQPVVPQSGPFGGGGGGQPQNKPNEQDKGKPGQGGKPGKDKPGQDKPGQGGKPAQGSAAAGDDIKKLAMAQCGTIVRPLINTYDIDSWARANGLPFDGDCHAEVADFVGTWGPPDGLDQDIPLLVVDGGARSLRMGDDGLELLFQDDMLAERALSLGNSADSLRIILAADADLTDDDLDDIEPYRGVLLFACEVEADNPNAFAKISNSDVQDAADDADRHPTPKQRNSGNYQKGHFVWNGLNVTVENAAGSTRIDRKGKWATTMRAPYGYICGTKDADGSQTDVFIGSHPKSKKVWVIDQYSEDGTFDEHKSFICYRKWPTALRDYAESYGQGAAQVHHQIGDVVEMTVTEFVLWLDSGKLHQPVMQGLNRDKLDDVSPQKLKHVAEKTTKSAQPSDDRIAYDGEWMRPKAMASLPASHAALAKARSVRRWRTVAPVRNRDHVTESDVQQIADIVQTALNKLRDSLVAKLPSAFRKADDVTATDWIGNANFSDPLRTVVRIEPYLDAVGTKAARAAVTSATAGRPVSDETFNSIFHTVDANAKAYARQRSAEMIGMYRHDDGSLVPARRAAMRIDDSTRQMLKRTITRSVDQGLSGGQLQTEIINDYAFSPSRALAIARTESAFAHAGGAMDGYRTMQDKYNLPMRKSWIVGENPCEECQANADQDPIGLDELFDSGDDAPPLHPNCRCDVVTDVPDDSADDGEGDNLEQAVKVRDLRKYSPEQPRDDHGRFAEGRESYTTADNRNVKVHINPSPQTMAGLIERSPYNVLRGTVTTNGNYFVSPGISVIHNDLHQFASQEYGVRGEHYDFFVGRNLAPGLPLSRTTNVRYGHQDYTLGFIRDPINVPSALLGDRQPEVVKYAPDQPRDWHGRFAGDSSGHASDTAHLHDQTHHSVVARIEEAERIAKSIPETYHDKSPERQALRDKIADALYNKDIENRIRGHDATIVLGLPGAGKSTLIDPLLKDKGAIAVNADLAKAMLPEYRNGLGALATHEESSDINRRVLARAIRNGDNLAYERVDSPGKIVKDIDALKTAGYTVHIKLMRVSPEVAERSVLQRFLTKGRYVPPSVVREFGTTPNDTYTTALAAGNADSYEVYERGPIGGAVRVAE